MNPKPRAPRNRTVCLDDADRDALRPLVASGVEASQAYLDRTFCGDCREITPRLPAAFADLLFLDPPYNMAKRFGDTKFSRRPVDEYTTWLGGLLDTLLPAVKPDGTVYICGDWFASASIFAAATDRLHVRNRITWEREKGRGAKANWKNSSEDIWFCTMSDAFKFRVDDVKIRRRVIAPYRTEDGEPRDWHQSADGNFRDTHPSNLWTDITVPFWSMPENTDHPTQKSEKLLAKLILASTDHGDVVFDPFLGSGTTSVVARKLDRRYVGIEAVEEYALLAEKRLALASHDRSIQGYADRIFWERNSVPATGVRSLDRRRPTAHARAVQTAAT